MVLTFFLFLYILIICYVSGFSVTFLMTKGKLEAVKSGIFYVFTGFGFCTVYAEFFSLFAGVGLIANLGLILICLISAFFLKRQLLASVKELLGKDKKIVIIISVLLLVFFAYGTSFGIMHVDSDLYHAQSIRWIEEYGVVKGLGNIHTRLAYNSASFCLSALFSMSFMGGQSFHVCQGFSAWILAVMCIGLFRKKSVFKPTLSNFARLAGIYYLLNIYDEMVSPASDYFMVTMLLTVLILFLEGLEKENADPNFYGILSLMGLVVLSVKISGALIVLICIYPVILFIKKKDFKSIIRFLITGIICVVPFFARNVILSGYLVYPVTGIDIFNPEYKIPFDIARYDEREIQVYGRGYSDVSRFDESITKWLPDWFRGLDSINKAAFVLAVVSVMVLVAVAIYIFVKKKKELYGFLLAMGIMTASFGYWMITAPIIRYGCVFLWLTPLLNLGMLYNLTLSKIDRGILVKIAFLLFILYKGYAFSREWISGAESKYLFTQQDYGHYDLVEYEVDKHIFYMPVEGGLTGYDPFPTIPYETEFRLLGTELKDGFCK